MTGKESVLIRKVLDLLNHQPNGIVIGYSHSDATHPSKTNFNHLSRVQQVAQIILMLQCGVDLVDLQTELYCVSHLNLVQVWDSFGIPTFLLNTEFFDLK